MIGRRRFVATAAAMLATVPGFALAQAQAKRRLVGFLSGGTEAATLAGDFLGKFARGMKEFGYAEGRDFDIVSRYADGYLDRLLALARELVRLEPDVIIANASTPALAAKRVTNTIPIVFTSSADSEELKRLGLIESAARPGGNVTGVMLTLSGLPGLQLQLAAELNPAATRIGMLDNVSSATAASFRREAEAASAQLGLKFVPVEVRSPDDIASAFQVLVRERVDLVYSPPNPMLFAERRQVVALAAVAKMGTIHGSRESVEEGGLMSYGVNLGENYRRAAYFVDRIWKGAKPGDLPVEFPTRLELVINMKTAKSLGLTIPLSVLLRADELIE